MLLTHKFTKTDVNANVYRRDCTLRMQEFLPSNSSMHPAAALLPLCSLR